MGKRTVGWGYIRAGLVSIESVLPLILDKSIEKVKLCGHTVNVTSLRLQTFAKKGLECSSCGLKATHFAVETKEKGGEAWHLNLWADRTHESKGEMLMTHDHTLARGLGGKDHIDNVTTMCCKCNHIKSIPETIEYNRRRGGTAQASDKAPNPKSKRSKRKAAAVANMERVNLISTIPMELAVLQFQAHLKRELKKNQKESAL